MRLVVTNAHKNPIVFDAPWLHVEDEEAQLILNSGRSEHRGESVSISPQTDGGDPKTIIVVGVSRIHHTQDEFYVDVLHEDEGPERVYSCFIDKEDDV